MRNGLNNEQLDNYLMCKYANVLIIGVLMTLGLLDIKPCISIICILAH